MSTLFLYGIYRLLGVRITSFYRTPEHNAEISGSVPTSKHQFFQALDVALDTPGWILDMTRKIGFYILQETDHFHIENTSESEIFFSGTPVAVNSDLRKEIADSTSFHDTLTKLLTNK